MPHLNVYVDEATRKKIRAAARKDKSSLSKWARKAFTRELKSVWPESFLRTLGSLEDSDLQRPDQGRLEDDVPRERL